MYLTMLSEGGPKKKILLRRTRVATTLLSSQTPTDHSAHFSHTNTLAQPQPAIASRPPPPPPPPTRPQPPQMTRLEGPTLRARPLKLPYRMRPFMFWIAEAANMGCE